MITFLSSPPPFFLCLDNFLNKFEFSRVLLKNHSFYSPLSLLVRKNVQGVEFYDCFSLLSVSRLPYRRENFLKKWKYSRPILKNNAFCPPLPPPPHPLSKKTCKEWNSIITSPSSLFSPVPSSRNFFEKITIFQI